MSENDQKLKTLYHTIAQGLAIGKSQNELVEELKGKGWSKELIVNTIREFKKLDDSYQDDQKKKKIEYLLSDLGSSDFDVQMKAVDELSKIGSAVVPNLLELLKDTSLSAYKRKAVICALGKIGDTRAVDQLLIIVKDFWSGSAKKSKNTQIKENMSEEEYFGFAREAKEALINLGYEITLGTDLSILLNKNQNFSNSSDESFVKSNHIENLSEEVQFGFARKAKKTLFPIFLLCILALIFGQIINWGKGQIQHMRQRYEVEVEQVEKEYKRQIEEQLTKHRLRMSDQSIITGRRAQEKHEKEWASRSDYDSSFARTQREKTILEIISLSKDKSIPDKDLLQRIAILAAPKESKIYVEETRSGYRVAVKFDMSVMTSGEHGSSTKHLSIKSLKREVIEIISRVSKDMNDHCGNKGIDRISVACTHGVQTQIGFIVTKTIYRCAITAIDARRVADWRSIPLHKVEDMFKVEHNEFPNLRIVTQTVPGFGW